MMKTFTICTAGYPGATPQPTFTIEAKDIVEASVMLSKWCIRHSYRPNKDAIVRKALVQETAWKPCNEYI